MAFTVRSLGDKDFFPWHALYEGYCEFYETSLNDEKAVRVWSWLTEGNELEARVAVDDEGNLIGLAHFRTFVRPLTGGTGIYLDDLFVTPAARAQGVASGLIESVRSIAAERKSEIVSWITAKDNQTARRLYDRLAEKTNWVTYDLPV